MNSDSVAMFYRWALVPLLGMLTWLVVREYRRIPDRHYGYILGLALCYPLGKLFQVWLWGPGFIRWYLADIGFVPSIALVVSMAPFLKGSILHKLGWGAGTGLRIALIAEGLQLLARGYKSSLKFQARGDWVDVGIFILTYLFVRHCVDSIYRKIEIQRSQNRPAVRRRKRSRR